MELNRGAAIFLSVILGLFLLYFGVFSFGLYGRGVTGHATGNLDINISLGNDVPVISTIGDLFACEDSSLNQVINATDADPSDTLDFDMSPLATIFFLNVTTSNDNSSGTLIGYSRIFSGTLSSSQVGSYLRNVSVDDGVYSDSEVVNITVIEINDAPLMTNIADQNLDLSSGSTFNYQVIITDEEDGNQAGGVVSFNSSFTSGSELFNVSSTGLLSYTASSSDVGNYTIKICVTDAGILNPHANIVTVCGQTGGNRSDCDSFNLEISESPSIPPVDSSSGGGGGGGGGASCDVDWGCDEWETCQFITGGLESGDLSGEDYRDALDACELAGWVGEFCGFQNRACVDVNECGFETTKPDDLKVCFYTENPDCSDGIENCHDGSCEFLVDCGGPCGACATCGDGIQNQGEEGIDCGGPCPGFCEISLSPFEDIGVGTYILIISLGIVIVVSAVTFKFFIRRAA